MSCRVTDVIDGCECAEAGSLDVMCLRMKGREARYRPIEIFPSQTRRQAECRSRTADSEAHIIPMRTTPPQMPAVLNPSAQGSGIMTRDNVKPGRGALP